MEEAINENIKERQQLLQLDFNLEDEDYLKLLEQFDDLKRERDTTLKRIGAEQKKYFSGTAFISFKTENQKQLVIEANQIPFWSRILNCVTFGRSEKKHDALYVNDRHLYVEQAPEPLDVNWEFVNHQTYTKQIARTVPPIYSPIRKPFSSPLCSDSAASRSSTG